MALEHWDAHRRRWIMYPDPGEHTHDCRKYPFDHLPTRIFLDTNVVNLMVKYREQVFEQAGIPSDLHVGAADQIEALMHIFSIGFRAGWDLVISAETICEIERTTDPNVRGELLDYAWQVSETDGDDVAFATRLGQSFAQADMMAILPDASDRMLIGNAIGLRCDVFCTRDIRTIVSKRHRLPQLPIRIMTPVEWWKHVKPWAGLWA